MVNENKHISENAFIIDLSALLGKKKSKYYKKTLFCGSPLKLDLLLNP